MPESRPSHQRLQIAAWLGLALLIAGLDQLSKAWIGQQLNFDQVWRITDWLNLVRVHNPGAAFSLLANAGGWQRWFFIGLGVLVMGWLIWTLMGHPHRPWLCAAMSLLLGGAAGNVWDRVWLGEVVDFVQVHGAWLSPFFPGGYFPSFNLADSAITAGVVLMLWEEWQESRRLKAQTQAAQEASTPSP